MQSQIVESVQHAVTPGEVADTYYQSVENTKVQAFASTTENRFNVSIPAPAFGSSSTILFNPAEGLGDIVLTCTIPAPAGSLYTNWALPKSWLASSVESLALRIGGSSLYYFSGDSVFVDTLLDCEDSGKRDAVVTLAGAELTNLAAFGAELNRTASIYIKLPFNSISALQKPLPLPTDMLTQPISILIQFKRADQVFFKTQNAADVANLPQSFSFAQMNFKQTHLTDQSKLLAHRMDMNKEAYSYGLRYFTNQPFRSNVTGALSSPAQINVTGFRQGSIQYMDIWAVKVSDIQASQSLKFTPITDVKLSVNGLIYYDSQKSSAQLWNLCNTKVSTAWNTTFLTQQAPPDGTAQAVPYAAQFVRVPFAQTCEPDANSYELITGLAIANSVVNLQLSLPSDDPYVITCVAHYNCALLFSRGDAQYIF